MEFISKELLEYCESHSTPEDHVLKELNRETFAKVMSPRMLSGHLQGSFLSLISTLIQPEQILEIGTYTGYSAICLARGLKQNGKLTTIDVNDELKSMVEQYLAKANVIHSCNVLTGDAEKIIPNLSEQFDLVFIDANKEAYSRYYDLVFDKLKIGGYILADNVLWSGNVIKEEKNWDRDTKHLVAFNEKVVDDKRVQKILLPIRDGIYLIKKISE
ncbi:MAG: O-methyltransferase [Bacteroidota bacterium]